MRFQESLRKFHQRSWEADVELLDHQLAGRGRQSSGLAHTPPSIITGDPFALEAGRCILVLGINPGWRDGKLAGIDASRAHAAWVQGFDSYRLHRSTYFDEAPGPIGMSKKGDARYSAHFSLLGNFIARAIGIAESGWKAGPTARRLFRERAAIFDLIPYWSTHTKHIDFCRIDSAKQPCVRDWHDVIDAFIAEKQPIAIFVNNCGRRHLVEAMLKTHLEAIRGTDVYVGLRRDNAATPVFAHPFLSRWYASHHERTGQLEEAAKQVHLKLPLKALAF